MPVIAGAAGLGLLLAGCSGADGGDPEPTSSPTSTSVEVTDAALGRALDALVFQGTDETSGDNTQCLVDAITDAGVSDEGLRYLVETSGDDRGKVIDGLRKVKKKDAAILLSPQLRKQFDACADQAVEPKTGKDADKKSYDKPKEAKNPKEGKPDLKPKYKISKNEEINAASDLEDGLISMFSSYAQSKKQKKIYQAASECLADVVFEAGFSQKTLRFLAGGAPIGVGSVADYLPDDGDKKIWRSQDFTQRLVDCTSNVDLSEDKDDD